MKEMNSLPFQTVWVTVTEAAHNWTDIHTAMLLAAAQIA